VCMEWYMCECVVYVWCVSLCAGLFPCVYVCHCVCLCVTKKTHRLSFSIMLNDLKRSQRRTARAFQDQVVKLFYEKL